MSSRAIVDSDGVEDELAFVTAVIVIVVSVAASKTESQDSPIPRPGHLIL